jgi:hypothetical protein
MTFKYRAHAPKNSKSDSGVAIAVAEYLLTPIFEQQNDLRNDWTRAANRASLIRLTDGNCPLGSLPRRLHAIAGLRW